MTVGVELRHLHLLSSYRKSFFQAAIENMHKRMYDRRQPM